MTGQRLVLWDFVAIGFYFLAVIGTGLYAMLRSRRNTVNGYFLAGRFMTWLPVGASLFASNIGSEHFIGLAGSGAASGIAVGAFELNACILLQLLGWVFLPVYIASGVCTLPEYIKKRFGGERIRIYLAVLSLMLYIFTKISVNLYSGALFIQQALNWNLYLAVVILLGLTALTTITGGLAAVIYTDTLQAFVMIIGACLLTILGFREVGGYSDLYRRYMLAIPNILGPWAAASNPSLSNSSFDLNLTAALTSAGISSVVQNLAGSNATTAAVVSSAAEFMTSGNRSALLECGRPRADSWYMLRDASDPDMPWPGFLLGQTPASIWYWCADQMIVQRTLAAKSLSHAQGSTLFAGYLKILPVFILVMPGMISRVLFPDEVACVDPEVCMKVCQNRRGCSNIAFPKLVLEIMPTGLRGLMMSVMLAALVSDLTSIFNSASTLFTMDIYRNIKKGAGNKELMIVGRVFVGLMVVVGILWIPIVQNMQGAQLYIYIQSVSAYLAPPIAAVYLLAVLWKRANEKGAFVSLMVGLVLGSGRMILNFMYTEPLCGQPDDRPWIISGLHYMYFAFILFLLTCVILVVVSLFTEKPTDDQIAQATYWTRFDPAVRPMSSLDSRNDLRPDEVKANGAEGLTPLDEVKNLIPGLTNGKGAAGEVTKETGDFVVRNKSIEIILEEPKKMKILSPLEAKGEYEIDHHVDSDGPEAHRSLISRFIGWFCGLNSSEEAAYENRCRIEEIQKLKQTRKEKIILTIFLVLLLTIDIFFYIFFSTGSDFWLLRTPSVDTSTSNQ